jgi:hypothetical protein
MGQLKDGVADATPHDLRGARGRARSLAKLAPCVFGVFGRSSVSQVGGSVGPLAEAAARHDRQGA